MTVSSIARPADSARGRALLETPIAETAPGQPDWAYDAAHLSRVYALAGREPPKTPYSMAVISAAKHTREKQDAVVS